MAIVVLKDLRRFSLEFASAEECGDVIESLEHLSSPGELRRPSSSYDGLCTTFLQIGWTACTCSTRGRECPQKPAHLSWRTLPPCSFTGTAPRSAGGSLVATRNSRLVHSLPSSGSEVLFIDSYVHPILGEPLFQPRLLMRISR